MADLPSYEELEQRIKVLEAENFVLRKAEKDQRIFETAIESSINAIGITDKEGKLIYINESCVKMWNYNSKEEMLGRFLPEFWEGNGIFKTVKKLKEKGIAEGEDIGKRKDGSLFYVQFLASMIKDNEGKPSFMFGSFFDITERKYAEESLKRSEEKAHSLFQNIQAAVVVHDPDTKIIKCNKASQELLGLAEDEILGKKATDPIWRFFNEDRSKMKIEQFPVNQVLATRKTKRGVIAGIYRSSKNDVVKVLVNAIPEFDEVGNIYQVIVTFMDITEHKLTQERSEKLNRLNEDLLVSGKLSDKLKRITDSIIEIFGADFARIWITKAGDLCNSGCIHSKAEKGSLECEKRDLCLHLISSSGRYTHINGNHRRIPYGLYKIGSIVSGEDSELVTNDVINDPHVHDKEWVRRLGLKSFSGFKLISESGKSKGVLALFSKQAISSDTKALLEALANTTSLVIQSSLKEDALLEERDKLKGAIAQIKILRGMLPICSKCKRIRDSKGDWNQLETYIRDHSEAVFSHSLCPECIKKLYPEMDLDFE